MHYKLKWLAGGWLAGQFLATYVLPAYEEWKFDRIPVVIERAETQRQLFPRSDPGMLHCVACSRSFPPPNPGDVQTDRTYCHETAHARPGKL